jgi:branched-chain amino acid transport system ATP-binding protein
MSRLEALDITVRFGGNVALDNVSLAVEPGQVTGLIGPNGAGKTTMFNVLTGLQAVTTGRVLLDGHDITNAPPHKRARLGLGRTFQRLELFTSLSVLDNLRAAADIRKSWRIGWAAGHAADVERVLHQIGLDHIADQCVAEIPTALGRLVELARALVIKPSVLLLDEPASGQSEQDTMTFGRLLRHLASETGIAICLIEHDMSLVMNVCDTIHVLDFGRTIAHGLPCVIREEPAVIQAYLGNPEAVR